jgi:hypothetical protein
MALFEDVDFGRQPHALASGLKFFEGISELENVIENNLTSIGVGT